MDTQEYYEMMKKMQVNLIAYLDNGEDYQKIKDLFSEINIYDSSHKFKSLLYLLLKISNNHHHESNFSSKIEQILQHIKDHIKKYFSNSEIIHIFKSNKRLLLFLITENIITIDDNFVNTITTSKYVKKKYPQFFSPEIKPFITDEWLREFSKNQEEKEKMGEDEEEEEEELNENKWIDEIKEELPENFFNKRKIGENDSFICELIRKDMVEDFITYINKNSIQHKSTVKSSIYETNSFLLKQNNITLIEYAVFFGSIKIINYLRSNKVELTPSLWLYTIHSNNAEIINILEENHIKPEDETYKKCLKESIKCHHNEVFQYIQNNYLSNEKDKQSDLCLANGIRYYNFCFEQNELNKKVAFLYLCQYDYYLLVDIHLREIGEYINMLVIYITNILIQFFLKYFYNVLIQLYFNGVSKKLYFLIQFKIVCLKYNSKL